MTWTSWARGLALSTFGALVLVAGCGSPAPTPSDAGPSDSAVDAASECTSDANCDDGLFCNGPERCSQAGRCLAGRAPSCDDGITCTTDVCSESLRACRSTAPDRDGDGSADAACTDGTTPLGDDCADDDANRFPGNPEVCDGDAHDEDCNPATHGATDADADGYESHACCNGSACGDDCDDAVAAAHPGGSEVCNHADDDCDGHFDEGASVDGFVDADRDGYGDPTMPLTACASAAGFSPYDTDCDDTDRARHPTQPELCDGVDNDCDGTTDETPSVVSWYVDADGDGFGTSLGTVVQSCSVQPGRSLYGTDCDDTTAARGPGATEICNGIDDDCNGLADYVIDTGNLEDDDRDGLADAMCGPPLGVDCDDRDPLAGPGQTELCNRRDDDCDGRVDEGATTVAFYRDVDGDGYGDAGRVVVACTPPAGFTRRGGDCDDTTMGAAVHPGATELCNGADEDCDGAVDESQAQTACRAMYPHTIAACVAGACATYGCDPGYAICGEAGTCDDLSSDRNHCGSCLRSCASGEDCLGGTCVAQPSSCAELRLRDAGATADGTYTIYFGGANDRPFSAYCVGMATASPQTYLELPRGTATNYSGYDATVVGGTTVTTLWTRVLLSGTSIVPNDYAYASSTGFVPHESTSQVPYGVARDCAAPFSTLGHAHVDLRGTPFAVSASSWGINGAAPAGTVTTSSFEQEADIVGGGYCGWNGPGGDRLGTVPLPLRWCPAPGPEVCNGIDDDCDGTVDDGCPQPGSVPVSYEAAWGPYANVAGGSAFSETCPSTQALVGVAGYYGGNIDQLWAHCGYVVVREDRSAVPFTYALGVAPGNDLGAHGQNVTNFFDLRCPPDQVVVDAVVQGDSAATGVTITCASLVLGGTMGNYTVTRGATSAPMSVIGSGGGSAHPTSTTAPHVLFGILGRSGAWLDALGFYEGSVLIVPQ